MAIAMLTPIGVAFAEPQPENGQQAGLANVAKPQGGTRDHVQRRDMRVSELHAGAEAAEVERVLGRPTTTTVAEESSDSRALVYADQPIRTRVTLAGGRVTAIALDLLRIDIAFLPPHARMVKPTMMRGAVLSLLGGPNADEKWTASGVEIEHMRFTRAGESDFSVFLADGVLLDVRPGAEKPADILSLILPAAILDTSVGTDLNIGLNLEQAASLLGPRAWTPTTSTLKGQPVLYATYHERSGHRLVSLTFTGGALTAFAIWAPDTTFHPGDTCCSADR